MESVEASRARAAERYVSLIKLASGGTATVYAGLDLKTGELVALKRPHEHLMSDPAFSRLLRAEVRIASRIVHPNVVPIVDVEQVDDVVRLVMPYVRGAALSELLVASARRFDPAVVVRIVADACAGLHAAHELRDDDGALLGVVHRDVSPHNLMVDTDGVTRVADFGIAKCVDASVEHSTTTGVLKGKFAYMAPEYVRGASIDRRVDVFALGVVLWEALAGKRLFKGSNQVESSRKVLEMPVPPLSAVAPELERFDPIVAAALAKDPAERVPTARAWLDRLETLPSASHADVARVVDDLVGEALAERQALIQKRLLVMAEVTATGARPPRDTLRMTTGFDPEDLAPTLVMPIVDVSGVRPAEAAEPDPAEGSTIPEPRAPVDPAPTARPRRGRWVVAAALGLTSAVAVAATLRARDAGTTGAPASLEVRKTLQASPSASEIEGRAAPASSSGEPALVAAPPASTPPQRKPPTPPPSASAHPARSSSPIIRNVDLDRRPNPYAN
jgi:tRNA A-37 threonylcarbamoyl transferase component Bud32